LIGLFILMITIGCSNERKEEIILAEYIPENSLYIIDTPNIENFLRLTDTVKFFKDHEYLLTSSIKEQLKTLTSYSKPEASIISLNKNKNGNVNFIFIAKDHPGEILI